MARVDLLADPPDNRVTNGRGKRSRCRSTTTLVEPIDTGMAWVIANRLRGIRPQAAFLITTLIGYATLVGALVALGLVLTKILIPIDAIRHADESVPGWMADHRSGWLDNASDIVSRMGDIPALPILVALILVIAALVRRFRIGAFLLTAVLMEVTAYRIGALAVPRQRPDVHRLDTLPVDQSFPSGHVRGLRRRLCRTRASGDLPFSAAMGGGADLVARAHHRLRHRALAHLPGDAPSARHALRGGSGSRVPDRRCDRGARIWICPTATRRTSGARRPPEGVT